MWSFETRVWSEDLSCLEKVVLQEEDNNFLFSFPLPIKLKPSTGDIAYEFVYVFVYAPKLANIEIYIMSVHLKYTILRIYISYLVF